MAAQSLKKYRRITVKIGSALLVDRTSGLKRDWLASLADDIAVLAWVMKTLDGELSAFRAWRERQVPEKLAVVERLPATPLLLEQEQLKKN